MWRGIARWFVTVVLALDAAAAFLYVAGGVLETGAATTQVTAAAPKAEPQKPAPAAATSAKETPALAEAKPAETAPPGDTIPGAVNPDAPAIASKPAPPAPGTAAKTAPPKSEAFLRLLRAYENMEPESAAKALAELSSRDKEAVVQLILGWKPRTSGAILDALTQINPVLAADLSYQVWKKSGEAAASSGS